MPCTELTHQHFSVLAQLRQGGWRCIYNDAAVPLIEEMAQLKMVVWDVSERPVHHTGALGCGRAKLLPDGASALADWCELRAASN
jgi:hypothetical protein